MNNLKIDELFTMICEVLDEHITQIYTESSTKKYKREGFDL